MACDRAKMEIGCLIMKLLQLSRERVAEVRVPAGSNGKEFACNARDPGSIPGSGRSPGEGNGNPLQYHCQENSMDRGAWCAMVHGVTKSWMRLSLHFQ